MKKWFYVALSLTVLSLYACQPKTEGRESFTIDGNIQGLNDSTYLYLRYANGDSLQIDSTLVNGGKFTFEGAVNEPVLAVIYEAGFKGYFQFYLENAKIMVDGKADSLRQVKITGSASQEDLVALRTQMKSIDDSRIALRKQYGEAKKAKDDAKAEEIANKLEALGDQRQEGVKTFIKAHPKSYVSVGQLRQLVYNTDYKELKSLFAGLDTSIQHSATGEKLSKHLEIMAKTAIGQPAPAFTQNDTSGKAVKLADFKGKYVLVDFWASWCGPCRRENPNVVKAYNKYKDKDFTILGVSLDDTKSNWLKAITDDGLAWTQVSDLKGWKNEVAQQYGVRAIPANFLISPEGVIIAHNLRGEALENKLKEVLE